MPDELLQRGLDFLKLCPALEAGRDGFSVIKIRYPLLFKEIHASKGTGMYLRYLKKLSRIKVLIFDNFLMQPIETNDCGPLLDVIEEKRTDRSHYYYNPVPDR